jgi:hypothetical protein
MYCPSSQVICRNRADKLTVSNGLYISHKTMACSFPSGTHGRAPGRREECDFSTKRGARLEWPDRGREGGLVARTTGRDLHGACALRAVVASAFPFGVSGGRAGRGAATSLLAASS